MKLIILKGNQIISEFTCIIYQELKKYYNEIEYQDNYNPINKDILHFIISPQIDDNLPKRYIIYNLEPLYFRVQTRQDYIIKLKNAEIIWEYSMSNMNILKKLHTKILYQPFLYSPFMENIYDINFNQTKKDIDVLFYGLMSPRRIKIIQQLKNANINVYCPNYPIHKPIWEKEKYELIDRAKIVINIHYHENKNDQTNDLLRIMFLFANKIPVIQEETCDVDIDDKKIENIVTYDKIVDKCKELLNMTQEQRNQYANKSYDIVKTKMFFNFNGVLQK
jgi:hypothetical protein